MDFAGFLGGGQKFPQQPFDIDNTRFYLVCKIISEDKVSVCQHRKQNDVLNGFSYYTKNGGKSLLAKTFLDIEDTY